MPAGIETRHSRSCRTRKGGRCDCEPTYRVRIRLTDREPIKRTFNSQAEAASWLKETMEVDVLIINGVPAGVEVPNFVELQVVKTDPGVRGDTASGAFVLTGLQPAALCRRRRVWRRA